MELSELVPSVLQRFLWVPVRVLLTIFCSFEIRGREHVTDGECNVIIASNHSSELDPIIIAASLPFFSRHLPLFFTSREKAFYKNMGWKKMIYGGRFFNMWGAHQAYAGLKNYEQALPHHLRLLRRGNTLSIFPTGRRVLAGENVGARGGVSFLTHATKLPIVPALIQGAERMSLGDFLLRKRTITITFGTPLFANDIFKNPESIIRNEVRNDYETAADTVMKKITQLA